MQLNIARPPRLGALALALALIALVAAGCASTPARPKAKSTNASLIVDPIQARALGYTPGWAFDLGIPAYQHLVSVTRVGDLLISVERPQNMVSAVSVRDGHLLWRVVIGHRYERLYSPVRDGRRIFINSPSRVYTLSARSGHVQQIGELDKAVNVGPVLIRDKAVFGALSGRIFAYDIDANDVDWAYQLTARVLNTPVPTSRGVFAADAQGIYALLNPADGTLLWRSRTFGAISAQPDSDTRNIYVPSQDRSLYALNLNNGEDAWVYRATAPLTQSPVVLGETCYLPIPGDGLVALDTTDGHRLWQLDSAPTPVKMQGDDLLDAAPRKMELRDDKSGALKASARVSGAFRVITGPDHSLIVVTRQGRLLRLNRQP